MATAAELALAAALGALAVILLLYRRGISARSHKAAIAAIGTAVPCPTVNSPAFLELCRALGYPAELLATVEKIVARGGIDKRHSCSLTCAPADMPALLAQPGKRAELWEQHAPALAVAAARRALAAWRHGSAADITAVVVHSCTGFAAPGLDYHVITSLGLRSDTRKLGVNYMGCFGGVTALYTAKQIVEAGDTASTGGRPPVVLVVCAEACSLHVSGEQKVELAIGNALFADGAGAAIVAPAGFVGRGGLRSDAQLAAAVAEAEAALAPSVAPAAVTPAFGVAGADWEWQLGAMSSEIIPGSGGDMTWRQSPDAPGRYDMWLSRSIPSSLASVFSSRGVSMLRRVGIANPWRCAWALHPGGKGIITAFETALAALRITPEGLQCSHDVLRQFGNMSSATIFFVLARVLSSTSRDAIFFAGFGPGLTVEFGALHRVARGAAAAAVAQGGEDEADAAAGPGAHASTTPSEVSSEDAASDRDTEGDSPRAARRRPVQA